MRSKLTALFLGLGLVAGIAAPSFADCPYHQAQAAKSQQTAQSDSRTSTN